MYKLKELFELHFVEAIANSPRKDVLGDYFKIVPSRKLVVDADKQMLEFYLSILVGKR